MTLISDIQIYEINIEYIKIAKYKYILKYKYIRSKMRKRRRKASEKISV